MIVREGVKSKVDQCLWIDKLRDEEEEAQARFHKHHQSSTVACTYILNFILQLLKFHCYCNTKTVFIWLWTMLCLHSTLWNVHPYSRMDWWCTNTTTKQAGMEMLPIAYFKWECVSISQNKDSDPLEEEINEALNVFSDGFELPPPDANDDDRADEIEVQSMQWSRLEQRLSDRIGTSEYSLFAPDERGWHSCVSLKVVVLLCTRTILLVTLSISIHSAMWW